ncbi:nuclear transport factor 2 family protein [Nocardia sp. alder85J]|uniref:nuclear transport factor 2 family protein n=1 Tax=Nocardia sp. alder85J TaxID=2862949 RepID=UPI001CD4D257|nr:nuclear transport factor 2 family protein [Nocardia sp. alder85J]MCX4091772.1 nuclear transport factor 2 family protein [Nocardia sp. alder85J]
MTTDGTLIGDLLHRNLLDVFDQRDRSTRRAVIAELFAPDARFVDHDGSVVGHVAIDAAAERVLTAFPQLHFAAAGAPSSVGDLGRLDWELRTADDVARVRGTDVATVADGRITRLWTFVEPVAAES